MNLNLLKEQIEKLNKFHQIEILKLLKNDSSCTLNENKNGVFVNLTNVNADLINKLEKYLDYVVEQEKSLDDIEQHKDMLTNTYFKDNKDNSCMSLNATV
jgi:ribosomal protein L30/L7E